ncbi:MAG: CheR family methyltransferase, partial [Acetobacteraceae bacterium]
MSFLPGTYLSVSNDVLRLSQPPGAAWCAPAIRLFAAVPGEGGTATVPPASSCRGRGADGSLGLRALKEKGGLIIAQDPGEAAYDGMPRSAIQTGAVDLVLPVAKIPEALVKYNRRTALTRTQNGSQPQVVAGDWLSEIVDLLRTKTGHDFRLYKSGTLQRRVERRMAMAAIEIDNMGRYLDLLRSNADELDRLAKDLLINVTSFFRDPKVFDLLAEKIVPDLVRGHPSEQPLRVWIAGCSTGEETYSLAMLFREQIAAAKRDIKLQVFASDVDSDAIAQAREGLYPKAIEADVSPARLARFFAKEEHTYRVTPELRAAVVFAVQDVLADPPFSRLDFVSCRNLLIYLRPEAQERVISLFHFALRQGGILLLGSAETAGDVGGRFELISKAGRLYRHIGRRRPGELTFATSPLDGIQAPVRPGQGPASSRPTVLGDLCRRLLLDTYAPAAVLINRKFECLYVLGPTDRYLRVAPGAASLDLLAMVREGMRTTLRSAIQQAIQEKTRIVVPSGWANPAGSLDPVSIAVQPVLEEGEELLLVCFIDQPKPPRRHGSSAATGDDPRVAELEQELAATRAELLGAIRNLEASSKRTKSDQ